MESIQTIPTELLLHIFTFLELKPYIISQGVCTEWRRLVPLAEIHPIRRRLYNLYQRIIQTPNFHQTRGWTIQNLQPFNRQAYIDALLAAYPAIPEEFRMWILEWPARLAIRCMWPGLPVVDCRSASPARRGGVNWLSYHSSSPELHAVIFKRRSPAAKFIPAMLIWRAQTVITDWLVFDQDEPSVFGRVYSTNTLTMKFSHSAAIPFSLVEKSSYLDDKTDSWNLNANREFVDWISYQEYHWRISTEDLVRPQHRRRTSSMTFPDVDIAEPAARIYFDRWNVKVIPAPPWSERTAFTSILRLS